MKRKHKKPLIKLTNSSWVKPSKIEAIRPLKREEGMSGHIHPSRVVVHHSGGCAEIIEATDDDHAIQMAEELAKIVNQ